MKTLGVAIVGASGYSGEELVRLLLQHPRISIECITSRTYAGQALGSVFPRFADTILHFSQPDVKQIADVADVAFLALPHGLAAEFAVPLLEAGVKVIDISADFRLRDTAQYEKYYGQPHPAPDLLKNAVYGLPERYRDRICGARLVACPGCYPTSVILPVAPLLSAHVLSPHSLAVASLSGVTGAGRKVDVAYIFPECNESVRPYAVTGHRHLPEIEQELSEAAGSPLRLNFVPHLVPVNRGIHSTIFADPQVGDITQEALTQVLHAAYDAEPFVRVLPEREVADTKHVTHTNTAEVGAVLDDHTGRVILSSAIDNLTKGASGQAVQCMNIMYGFDETLGILPNTQTVIGSSH
ncbi:MAG: N-acetyl-gamma-glutamyl-phosphate reductase [Candidatus Pacebacteria bacterium]|nr:N-acetyl-gamma-glutamyl-phosphate reductase [Candidatus Paceibacterota bacterium]